MMTRDEYKQIARCLYSKGLIPSEVANELVRAGANVNSNNQAMKIANEVYAELEAAAEPEVRG